MIDANSAARSAPTSDGPGLPANIVDALAYPALAVTASRRIIAANTAARALFDDDLAGKDFVRIMRHPHALECLSRVIRTGDAETISLELQFTTRRTFELTAGRIAAPDETFFLVTLLDVSAEIDAERSRSTFVANVSHELRSPLTTLAGAVETLQGPARDDPKAQDMFLGLMSAETARMSRLVGDLLSLAKLEAKEHVAPDGAVDIVRVIKSVVNSLAASDTDYPNRVEITAQPGMLPVSGSEDELTEVFQNLIENALKYSTPATPVSVTITQRPAMTPGAGGRAIILIEDQGEGMERKHLSRLTERFYRVDKGRSREMGGTGLGLAITKHILNRHRGRMAIDSTVGEGTRVKVILNIKQAGFD